MPITEMLSRNARIYPDKTSLIERRPAENIRREITWLEFENISNSFANALIAQGIKKGDKIALLMKNCLEWLPVYFGILKTGALAVPLNFRFTAEEIEKCLETAEAKVLIYESEFIERIDAIRENLTNITDYIFVGENCPEQAIDFTELIQKYFEDPPAVDICDNDDAALYFTSGTTGVPKPIVLTHANLVSACITENRHHLQSSNDTFVCIPPLYHTGAKMHWFGSLI